MVLPVIADVFRVTFNYSETGGVSAHNVLHFRAASGDEEDLFNAIDDNLTSNMLAPLPNGVTMESVDIIALDGASATQPFAITNSADGQATGEILPAYAAVVGLHTNHRGPQGRGRIYLGPIGESASVHGFLPTESPGEITTAWSDFANDMQGDGFTLVVASYVHEVAYTVSGISVRQALGVQRRRQNQLL